MKKDLKSLIKRIKEYNSGLNEKRLIEAFEFAEKLYDGTLRLSGDPVILHVLETAKILTTQKVDEDTIIASLLHELPNYTKVTSKDVEKKFGKSVGVLISAYEKMGTLKEVKHAGELETLRKMCLVMAKDLRVVLIKLADRLHNLQTLEALPIESRKRIARETLDIYVPIASRLGVYRIRSILEDLCFKFLKQEDYKSIQEQLKLLGKKKKNVIDKITQVVKDFMKDLGLEAKVSGRLKNSYSIYKKLKKKGKSTIDEIHDIFAIRIIIPTQTDKNGNEIVSNLYELIGHIHNKWKPLPRKFKDYVGFPKPNGYKSLHTTIMGLAPHSFKEPVEIQIRSEKMHEEAEYGVASHWIYKETKGKNLEIQKKQKAQIEWIKNLAEFSKNIEDEDSAQIINELKIDIFQDRIFVFTPKGDVKDMPAESTPIDFAYAVHTDIGNKCVMAKINANVVPLNTGLNNGDVVEIITKSDSKPKLEWLSFVKTAGAKAKIKNYFNSNDQVQNFKIGKELLNKKLIQIGKPQLDPKLSILKEINGKAYSLKEREELIAQIGGGSMLPSQLIWKIYSYDDIVKRKKSDKNEKPNIVIKNEKDLSKNIIVGGQTGMPIRIAKCCKPSFGVPIKAFISRGEALSIHKRNCRILKMSDISRHINANWVGIPDEDLRQIELIIETGPDTMIMKEITKALSNTNMNITHFHINSQSEKSIEWLVSIEIDDFEDFERVLNKISLVEGVNFVRKKD